MLAADGDLDDVLDVGGRQAVARQRAPVQPDRQHGQPADLLGLDVGGPGNLLNDALYATRHLQQRIEIVAEYLDADVAADARDQLVEAHLDWLGEFVIVARNFLDPLFNGRDEVLL